MPSSKYWKASPKRNPAKKDTSPYWKSKTAKKKKKRKRKPRIFFQALKDYTKVWVKPTKKGKDYVLVALVVPVWGYATFMPMRKGTRNPFTGKRFKTRWSTKPKGSTTKRPKGLTAQDMNVLEQIRYKK